ncbi:hypothetical protein [Actinacidiphila glaucinigra]|uniref:hypothetical protein n=1 Tax=Actinacidiphila glaucinigra TaxID=235986 RepID=UPI003D8B4306
MIRVRRSVAELTGGQRVYNALKSEAGKRTVAIPAGLPVIDSHMKICAETGAAGRVFVGAKGATRAGITSTGGGTRHAARPA